MADRSNTWLSIAYLDSLPTDWQELIESWQLPVAVSPLHNLDVKPNGEVKKPHYHVLYRFSTLKSVNQVKYYSEQLKGTIPIICHDYRASLRYMCHLDCPKKTIYVQEEMLLFGGIDISRMNDISDDDYLSLVYEIADMCTRDMTFYRLMKECSDLGAEYVRTLLKYSYFFGRLCIK